MHDEHDEVVENDLNPHAVLCRELDAARKVGAIYSEDRRVLMCYALRPFATMKEIATDLGWSEVSVINRLNNARNARFKRIIDGTVAEKMTASLDQFSTWLLETMTLANRSIESIITEIEDRIPDEMMRAKTITNVLKRIDPFNVSKLGGTLLGYATAQAQAQAAHRVGTSEALPSSREALAILEADVITGPDTPILEVKPIGQE